MGPDVHVRAILRNRLEQSDYRVVEASSETESLSLLQTQPCRLVIVDHQMSGGGLNFVTRVKAVAPSMPLIIVTDYPACWAFLPSDSLQQTHNVHRVLHKPLDMVALLKTVREALAGKSAD